MKCFEKNCPHEGLYYPEIVVNTSALGDGKPISVVSFNSPHCIIHKTKTKLKDILSNKEKRLAENICIRIKYSRPFWETAELHWCKQ
jgi:hypothetical protein